MPIVEVVRAPVSGDDYGVFGKFYLKFFNRILDQLYERLEPNEEIRVCFEAPILPRPRWDDEKKKWVGGTTIQTTRRLHSLGVILETACEMHVARTVVAECNLKSMKALLTGKGNAEKADMFYAAQRAGIALPPGDEALDGADGFSAWLTGVKYWSPSDMDFWLKRIHGGHGAPQLRLSAKEARRLL